MNPVELIVARIGNSRGVRLPAATLARYKIGERVIMEERSDGILLRPASGAPSKLSWDETAREMAVAMGTSPSEDAVTRQRCAGPRSPRPTRGLRRLVTETYGE